MSSAQEKVKDLLEVRTFDALRDFHSEPSATLDSYKFTDITAGLMAGWLDAVSRAGSGQGNKKALAGYRGVGKSHFIAAFGAILANPELRSKITNSYVATSAGALLRRRYPVANVLRGTLDSLFEELRAAVALALGIPLEEVPRALDPLIELASERSGDMPFVILIDTAFDRKSRVQREDGAFLGDLAAATSSYDFFIGVALDDDITDAEGTNAAIVQQYAIDYLEQEHLYRIVDGHIFPKKRAKVNIIDEAYRYFRNVIPGFRFSQQRFSALYPLHPQILEIAPLVRLYAPDFALLSFASEAGKRILGRPSRSLIGLDEVFDCVEPTLRDDGNLKGAFEVYDTISSRISSLVPVVQRLQAKLVLKALFILSLEGEGVTPEEVAAAILVYDEHEPQAAIARLTELLEKFVSVFRDDLWRLEGESGTIRYSLKVSGKDDLNMALSAAIDNVPEYAVPSVLKKTGKDRFSDWMLSSEKEAGEIDWSDVQVLWRGSYRKVKLIWNWSRADIGEVTKMAGASGVDLYVVISGPGSLPACEDDRGRPLIYWQPADLTSADVDTIRKYFVLLHDQQLRRDFADQIGPAGHTHTVAVEKIFRRVFLEEPRLIFSGSELRFEKEVAREDDLGSLLAGLAASVLDEAFPAHPVFEEPLGMREVSVLVSDLFSGARIGHQSVQHLAQTFALPLGLVSGRGENLVLAKEEELFEIHLVEKVLSFIGASEAETVPLEAIYQELREQPYGLAREAQHLILSALVAQGMIEFVTSKGDRINRRSLDLRIIWDDIKGVSKPEAVHFSSERLGLWARLLTGEDGIRSIDIADDRKLLKLSLRNWLDAWKKERILERFDEIPSESLNTRIWAVAINAEKTFGAVERTLTAFFDESISLEESLQRIADAFSDSEAEFQLRSSDLVKVRGFVDWENISRSAIRYLALSEATISLTVEETRGRIEIALAEGLNDPGTEAREELQAVFDEFRNSYADVYLESHNRLINSHDIQEKLDEVLASDEWWEFLNLSRLPILRDDHLQKARNIVSRIRALRCTNDIRERLLERPFCDCGFKLAEAGDQHLLPKELIAVVLQGSDSYKRTLHAAAAVLGPILEAVGEGSEDEALRSAASSARRKITSKGDTAVFTTEEMQQLSRACERIADSRVVNAELPRIADVVSASELAGRLEDWLSELPDEPLYLGF